MGRPAVHRELMSKDPAGVNAFYEKLFGWKIDYVREINYRIVDTGAGSGINGGIVKPDRERRGPATWCSMSTWTISRRTAGPGMGAFSLFSDPEGRMMGLRKAR